MGRFSGKTAIVTGSSNGIGAATALQFAKEGANVTITGRNVERLEELRKKIQSSGVPSANVHVVVGDITDENVQKKIVDETVAKFGKLDILVSNAGASINDLNHPGTTSPEAVKLLQKNLDLNLTAVLSLTNFAKPHLIKSQGEVVNISSIVGLPFGFLHNPYYAISKAAQDQLTRAQALELIKSGVRVNTVNPGGVETGFVTATGVPEAASKKVYDYFRNDRNVLPMGYLAQPEDIASVILFLSNRAESKYIVGQNIIADGGSAILLSAANIDFKAVLGL